MDGSIRVYNGTRYFVLFGPERYDAIYTTGLDSQNSGIIYVVSHNYARIKVDSYHCFPLGKTLTLNNVIVLIKSLFNKNQNNY